MVVTVQIYDRELVATLRRLALLADDMSPVMRPIAGVLLDASQRAFKEEKDPITGQSWPKLTKATIRQRLRQGTWPGKMLNVSPGGLAASVQADYGKDFAVVGTNKVYAPTQFFGAARGAFGSTKRGRPIPWGNIPGRRFMGWDDSDRDEIAEIVLRRLRKSAGA